MKIHMVKKGDTLYGLAQKYHVDLEKLIAMNPQIADPDKIDVGMKVKIPSTPIVVEPPADSYAYKHVVVQGDSLWKLAKAAGVPLEAVIEANPQLKNPNVLLTGEVVYIPKIGTGSPHEGHHMHGHATHMHGHAPHMHGGKVSTAPIVPSVPMEQAPAPENFMAMELHVAPPVPQEAPVPAPAPAAEAPAPTEIVIEQPAPVPVEQPADTFEIVNVEQNISVNDFDGSPPSGLSMMTDEAKGLSQYQSPHTFGFQEPSEDLFAQFHIPATKAGDYPVAGEPWSFESPAQHYGPSAWNPAAMGAPMMPYPDGVSAYPGLSPMDHMQAGAFPAQELPVSTGGCGCGGGLVQPYAHAGFDPTAAAFDPPAAAFDPSNAAYPPMHHPMYAMGMGGPVMPAYAYPYGPHTYPVAYGHSMFPGGMVGPMYGYGDCGCGCGGHKPAMAQEAAVKEEIVSIRNQGNVGEAETSAAKPKKGAKAQIRSFVQKRKSAPKPKRKAVARPWINV